MFHSSQPLPPECNNVNPCTDVVCQRAIADSHEIPESDFQSRILPDAGGPKVLSAGSMQQILSGTCGTDFIILNQNVRTNQELNPVSAQQSQGMVAYSYPLFKGIFSYGAESFSYYLATGGATGRDVIFKVTFGEGQPDKYYDFSGETP